MKILVLIFCGAVVLTAAEEKPAYESDGMRDPMSKVKKVKTQETEVTEKTEDKSRVQEIQQTLSRCRIEGIAICGDDRCVVINDSILSEGDPILPDSDITIGKIEEGKITFVLENSEVEFILTPVEEDVIPM
jgi:hypothetical protein